MKHTKIYLIGIILLVLIALNPTPKPFVQAQDQTCYWELYSEVPQSFTAPTAEGATASINGSTAVITYQGLTVTHEWTPPPNVLYAYDVLLFEVSVSWTFSGDYLSSGGLHTDMNFWGIDYLRASQGGINFNNTPTGSVSNSDNRTIPKGVEGGDDYFIMAYADAAVGGARVDYKYHYVCEKPEPIELEYGRWQISDMNGEVNVIFPVGKDKHGNFVYDEDNPLSVKLGMKLPVGARLITGDTINPSFVIINDDLTGDVLTMKPDSTVDLIGGLPEEKNVLQVLWGTLKINAGKVLRGEKIETKNNLATLGIKGTIYILEVTADQIILKVTEGVVEITAHADGSTALVNPGEMITADANGLSPITTFDIQAELATWPEEPDPQVTMPLEDPQGSPQANNLMDFFTSPPLLLGIIILLFGLVGLALSVILLIVRTARNRKTPAPLPDKKSSNNLTLILIITLLILACLTTSCGLVSLILNFT